MGPPPGWYPDPTATAVVAMVISGALALIAIVLGAQLITAGRDDHQSRLASFSPGYPYSSGW